MMTIAYLFDIRSEASSAASGDGSSAALPFTADTEKRVLSADTHLCCASISYSYSIVSHLFTFVKSFSL